MSWHVTVSLRFLQYADRTTALRSPEPNTPFFECLKDWSVWSGYFCQDRLRLCLLVQKVCFLKLIGFTGFIFSKRRMCIPLTNVIAPNTHLKKETYLQELQEKLKMCTQSPPRSQRCQCLECVELELWHPWTPHPQTQEQHGKDEVLKRFLIAAIPRTRQRLAAIHLSWVGCEHIYEGLTWAYSPGKRFG